jgi:inhibitor of cysteine peptidase
LARLDVFPADDGNTFVVAAGDELIVTLPENPTTGYRWELDSPSAALVLERDEPRAGRVPGAGGVRVLAFRAAAAGRVRLSLQLRRAWETMQPPLQKFSVVADIR